MLVFLSPHSSLFVLQWSLLSLSIWCLFRKFSHCARILPVKSCGVCGMVGWCLVDWILLLFSTPVLKCFVFRRRQLFSVKKVYVCDSSANVIHGTEHASVILCWVSPSVTQNYELIKTVNISFYVTYFSTNCYSCNGFRLTLVTFRPSITIKSKVSSWWWQKSSNRF